MTSDDNIQEDGFGFAPQKAEGGSDEKSFRIVRRYTMTNKNEGSVRLISWGAGIQSIRVPNSRGILGDIVLGFDDMEGYLKNRYLGRIVNSIADRTIDTIGKKFSNFENDRDNIYRTSDEFHDIDNVNWESYISGKQVVMTCISRALGKRCLSNMLIQVKYSWTDENELNVNIRATVTESTPANITLYCPMNLAGHAMGVKELQNHIVTINSDNWIGIDERKKCPNKINKVECTLYDLRNPTLLKNRLFQIPEGGYDHDMCINSPSIWCYRFHSRILHPDTGRFLEVYSNQANLKFSTGNDFPDPDPKFTPRLKDYMWERLGDVPAEKSTVEEKIRRDKMEMRGKDGALYRRHGAFICSPQDYPNNGSIFPNCILHPGEVFVHNMSYKFGVKPRINHEIKPSNQV